MAAAFGVAAWRFPLAARLGAGVSGSPWSEASGSLLLLLCFFFFLLLSLLFFLSCFFFPFLFLEGLLPSTSSILPVSDKWKKHLFPSKKSSPPTWGVRQGVSLSQGLRWGHVVCRAETISRSAILEFSVEGEGSRPASCSGRCPGGLSRVVSASRSCAPPRSGSSSRSPSGSRSRSRGRGESASAAGPCRRSCCRPIQRSCAGPASGCAGGSCKARLSASGSKASARRLRSSS